MSSTSRRDGSAVDRADQARATARAALSGSLKLTFSVDGEELSDGAKAGRTLTGRAKRGRRTL